MEKQDCEGTWAAATSTYLSREVLQISVWAAEPVKKLRGDKYVVDVQAKKISVQENEHRDWLKHTNREQQNTTLMI